MTRAFILVMDSFGIGATHDAAAYGDSGADTLGHIADACAAGEADNDLRRGPLTLPTLNQLGLGAAHLASTGRSAPGLDPITKATGLYGFAEEVSAGKDTPSGHWEMAGVPVTDPWGYFPKTHPCFPAALTDALMQQGGYDDLLGNCHASGTEIIASLGEEHIQTGHPIIYTSADSVVQIAAHEDHFGLDRLYALCELARKLVDDLHLHIGRVIARPFTGEPGHFERTGNRRDYSTPPPAPTLLDQLKAAGREVIAIGKIADIFAHQGLTQKIKAHGNDALFEKTFEMARSAAKNSLTFTNFVDFDMKYGHRRDIPGYAHALESFDQQLKTFISLLQPGDLAIITADHGCDPSFPGSDHTREHVPVLAFGPGISGQDIGKRATFADIGQTVAKHLGISPLANGTAFL